MQKPMRFDQTSGQGYVSRGVTVCRRVAYTIMGLACLVRFAGTTPAWAQAGPSELRPSLARQLKAVMEE